LIVWALAQSHGDGHHSLVTPERLLSEYNEDLIFLNLDVISQIAWAQYIKNIIHSLDC